MSSTPIALVQTPTDIHSEGYQEIGEAGRGEGRHRRISTADSVKFFIFGSKLNLLLFLLPVALILPNIQWSEERAYSGALAVFVVNFVVIIPLSKLLGTATEEIALHTNPVVGGLLNATFGNAIELIIAIIALGQGLTRVVQASLMGSILSNLLLVLGFCFLFGGLRYSEQSFNMTSAQTSSSMLTLSVLAISIPAVFDSAVLHEGSTSARILSLSRGASIILLVMYGLFLVFQLKTHAFLYEEVEVDNENPIVEEEESHMTLTTAIACLVAVTVVVSVCAEYLVGSVETVSEVTGWSETFIGLIIIPIVGNAAGILDSNRLLQHSTSHDIYVYVYVEHVSSVSVAMKNKMELAIAVAVGSSSQVALLLTPLTCIVGWIIGEDMSLDFHAFETVVLFLTVLIVNYIIQDGKSNWLEGAMLLGSYCIIALAFYLYPK